MCRALDRLASLGYQVEFRAHAQAIMERDFPDEAAELVSILEPFSVHVDELLRVGGGESEPTQRLRGALASAGWTKHRFRIERRVDGRPLDSISHEIDHVRHSGPHMLALEIEWNNKDTFFDRDLENFKRLHSDAIISVGCIITRGETFHDSLAGLVHARIEELGVESPDHVRSILGIERTIRQQGLVADGRTHGSSFCEAFARQFVSDKFGTATTHWRKLQERLSRGLGGACPLLLVGIPRAVIRSDQEGALLGLKQTRLPSG
ncbi:MAG: BglII/BstYI family type II restriction endonuclease [Armatimonadetes bacterium]|nr:BglII/BstYI family type II restriction endonuclease [Armatimonadota bacterium]